MNRRQTIRTINTPHARTNRQLGRGFTIIEVIVAVTIVALLAALVAPRFVSSLRSSTRKSAQIEVATIHKQVELFMIEKTNGILPENFELLELTEGNDPYLNNADDLLDPWGNQYYCETSNPVYNIDFDIISFGSDGQPGGEDDAADIVSGQD
jgi:general secretion pathway protein G